MNRTFPFGAQQGIGEDPALRDLRKTEPVCKVQLYTGGEAWLVTGYEEVRFVASDPKFSRVAAMEPGTPTVWPDFQVPQGLLNMDPPDHGRVRKLLAAAFTPRRVERLRPRVQEIVDELLDGVSRHGDFYADFAYPLPVVVISEVLGLPNADKDQFRAWLNVFLLPDTPFEVIGRTHGELHQYLTELIAAKRRSPGDDVLTAMIEVSEDGDRLSDNELLQNTQTLIFAGQDTTASMLANGLITLFRHPDQLALLRQRPELLPAAVEELLRYVPTLLASPTKVATADVEIGGVIIRAGEAVLTVERSANKDETVFDDPERFDINRSSTPGHLGFGHGPHFCLGASLARLELTTALGTILRRFPNLRLAVPESDLEWLPSRLLYTVRELPIVW